MPQPGRTKTPLVGLVVLGALFAVSFVIAPSRAAIVISDTSVAVEPSSGGAGSEFKATLAYTPRNDVCPATSTTVSFTWDGYSLGSTYMERGFSPCYAKLTTKPLAGHNAAGTHRVCGTFESNGTHRGCADYTVTSASSVPSTTSTKPRTVQSAAPARPRATTDASPATVKPKAKRGGSAASAPSEQAAPEDDYESLSRGNALAAFVLGGAAFLSGVFWLPGMLRRRRASRRV